MPDACAHEWTDTGLTVHRRPVKRCTRCGKWLKAHAACAGYGFLEEGPGADRFCLGCDGAGLVIVAEIPARPAVPCPRCRMPTGRRNLCRDDYGRAVCLDCARSTRRER